MYTAPFSIKDALRFAWGEFKKDPWFFVGVAAALFIVQMVVNGLTGGGHGVSSLLGFLISLIASTVITIAYTRLALSTAHGQHATWEGLWAPQYFFPMLGAWVLQTVAILVGLVLIIIPGIVAALLLSMTSFVVMDKNMQPVEALKESYRLTRPHLWVIFKLVLVLILLNILGAVALVVGLLVTIPVSLIAMGYVYIKLSGVQEPVVTNATTTP